MRSYGNGKRAHMNAIAMAPVMMRLEKTRKSSKYCCDGGFGIYADEYCWNQGGPALGIKFEVIWLKNGCLQPLRVSTTTWYGIYHWIKMIWYHLVTFVQKIHAATNAKTLNLHVRNDLPGNMLASPHRWNILKYYGIYYRILQNITENNRDRSNHEWS